MMAGILMLPVFYVVVFHLQKNAVQQQMQQQLKRGHLITLHLPAEKINWYKPDKEILVEGVLFDIESIVYHNGMATITGLYDQEEKELDEELSRATGHNSSSTFNTILAKLLGFFFMANEQINTFQMSMLPGSNAAYPPYYLCQLPFQYLTVPTPPPLGKCFAHSAM